MPCPLVEPPLAPGAYEPRSAPAADLRTDLGRYRVWRGGVLADTPRDVRDVWTGDLVAFLIGCSFTFDHALAAAGLPPRHYALDRNVPMYRTSVPLAPAGRLRGVMVVSMRPYRAAEIERVRDVTRPYRVAHGEPVAWGDPAQLGIADLMRPDYGDPPVLAHDDVPVFWGCGVTPQAVIVASKTPVRDHPRARAHVRHRSRARAPAPRRSRRTRRRRTRRAALSEGGAQRGEITRSAVRRASRTVSTTPTPR